MLVSLAVVSQVWFDKLPPDLQKLVVDTARTVGAETQAWQINFSKELDADWIKLGGKVHTLPAEDLAAMKTKLGGVADAVTKDQPAVHEMLLKVRKIAAQH
jgi:TRAP-type C4-dicarboxylate transport system substrate-binding protein